MAGGNRLAKRIPRIQEKHNFELSVAPLVLCNCTDSYLYCLKVLEAWHLWQKRPVRYFRGMVRRAAMVEEGRAPEVYQVLFVTSHCSSFADSEGHQPAAQIRVRRMYLASFHALWECWVASLSGMICSCRTLILWHFTRLIYVSVSNMMWHSRWAV